MTDDQKILNSFHAMDDDTQQAAINMFRNLARDFPRVAKLQLVHSAGVNIVQLQPANEGSQVSLTLRGK